MAALLRIALHFPPGYAGADERTPEELPSPARVHEAFVAAAAGGPEGVPDGDVLVATDMLRDAVAWLERHEPLGVSVPALRMTAPEATRYRYRASPVTLNATTFESRSAMDGPVTFYWPAPDDATVERLRTVARDVTHVGRADSIPRITVDVGESDGVHGTFHANVTRRGPGRVLRIPLNGRFEALEIAHRGAARRSTAGKGNLGKQATDSRHQRADGSTTALRRFAPAGDGMPWPFDEVWRLGDDDTRAVDVEHRVHRAGLVHRALVAAIGDDVPPFVTGRSGNGPLRGAGHLAIQIDERGHLLLAIPRHVSPADRATLAAALDRGLHRRAVRFPPLRDADVVDARSFWGRSGRFMRTAVPMVLDAPGTPRRAPWTLSDSVVCSIGYALRDILDHDWTPGWAFRRTLVDHLRAEHGVDAEARRVHGSASRYVHRADSGDLLVAVHARVDLGDLALPDGAFLALGRGRHVGGGLLVPTTTP